MKRTGLTAGGGMVLGMIFGAAFGNAGLGMMIGMLLGAAVAGARRRRAATGVQTAPPPDSLS